MTDESEPIQESAGSDSAGSESGASENAASAAYSAAKASLDSNEKMIALGAFILLLGVYVIGDLALDEWSLGGLTLAASVGALALMYTVKMKSRSVPIPYAFSQKVLSYLVGVIGVWQVLWFVDGGRADGAEIVFTLFYFVGVIAMVMGARALTD